jgi:2-aminoadipate transaminase
LHPTFLADGTRGVEFPILRTRPQVSQPAQAKWLRASNNITQQFLAFSGRPDVVSLAGGLPAAELYPIEEVEAAARRAIANHGTAALEYGPVEGLPALRRLVAERVSNETGGFFTSANVLLTTGAMQGLDLIGKVLVDCGDTIAVQSPTYVGALDAWRPREPLYRKLDWEHPDLEDCKFVYTVPNYSNPTGVLVPQPNRVSCLEHAVEAGTWLVEDDPYRCMQLDGPPGPSILEHYVTRYPGPYAGPVLYLGTVSKSLVPGLRVGWVIAEANMIQTLALAKQSSDLSGSMLTQAIVYELLHEGFDVIHAKTIVPAYRERRDALCQEAALRLNEWFEWEIPVGGMFVWMRAKANAIDTSSLYHFAVEEKVAFVPSSVFDFAGEDCFGMRVNFTRNPPHVLREGVERLERAIRKYLQYATA